MNSLWRDDAAKEAHERWGALGESMALRLYTARLIGSDRGLVLHGGGNVSVKGRHRTVFGDEVDAVFVKGSGHDLATLDPAGLPGLDLGYLRRLRALDGLEDATMFNELRLHLFDAEAPTPSIETLLHAFLPHRFVDHSHADAVLILTNQPEGASLVREALGDRVAILDYVTPGFELAKAVADLCDSDASIEGVVLLQHGLITFGNDARSSYERHVQLVDACERLIDERIGGQPLASRFETDQSPEVLSSRVSPMLRGMLAWPTADEDQPYIRSVLEWRGDAELMSWVNSDRAERLAGTGPLTSDHLIRTKPRPLFVRDPDWSDDARLRGQLEAAVGEYRDSYRDYVLTHGGTIDSIDTSPVVILMPGAGVFCWGRTKRDARIAADITEQTLRAKLLADALGEFVPLSDEHLFAMEYRGIQRSKLGGGGRLKLAGQVVVISGGGGAIGAAVAEGCAAEGAHVAVADLDAERLSAVADRLNDRFDRGVVHTLVMDVTDESSVRSGFDEICRVFGGVDVVVPNAGIAHVSAIESLKLDDFQRVMNVNATGYLLFMREGIRILKRQQLGGHIVINASKNVFGPGKDFGAYSASKAAGHQLGKVAAIELADAGIRVNMINADAVFSHKNIASGLWAEVGPGRAASRGMDVSALPDYYRGRNLLKARVMGYHVANAVVFFASNATPTTGATLPVDGGVVEAFPR